MRLMNRDLCTYKVFKTKKICNDYVGSSLKEIEIGKVNCIVSPVSDSYCAEIYGEQVKNMVEFVVPKKHMVCLNDGDILKGNDNQYRIVSIKEYPEHYQLVGEKFDR